MTKAFKPIISRYAEDDLIEIIEYFFIENPQFSQKLISTIEGRISERKNFPERGRIVPELEKQSILNYREIIESNYRILYSVQNDTVMIHTILDGRRNIEDLIIRRISRLYS